MFDIQKVNDISVVEVKGELSRNNILAFDQVLSSLSKSYNRNVVLDFGELDHLDYRLVDRLSERVIEFQCDGGDIRTAGANGYVKSIMRAMGFEEDIYDSVENALLSYLEDTHHGEPQ